MHHTKPLFHALLAAFAVCSFSGCGREERMEETSFADFVDLVVEHRVEKVELIRSSQHILIVGETVPSQKQKLPGKFTVRVARSQSAALRGFLCRHNVPISAPLGDTDLTNFVVRLSLATALAAVAAGVVCLFRRRLRDTVVWLWSRKHLVGRAARNTGYSLLRSLKLLTPSADHVFNCWVLLLETIERFVIATLVLGVVLWGCCRYAPSSRPLFGSLLDMPIPFRVPVPVQMGLQAARLSLVSLVCCLAVGALGRLFYVTRLVYRSRGLAGRILWMAAPSLCIAASVLKWVSPSASWPAACALCAIPTVFLLPCCVAFTEAVLPEIDSLVRLIGKTAPERDRPDQAPGNGHSHEGRREAKAEEENHAPSDEIRHAETLGVTASTPLEEIRKRYLHLAKQYHPDKVHGLGPKLRSTAEREMKDINEAYLFFVRKHKHGHNP